MKTTRYKLFSNCLEYVTAKIDSIYKVGIFNYTLTFCLLYSLFLCTFLFNLFSIQNLVNDTSAQAIILPDNPEEPYAGNIIYNCIAPSKGFQPLQCLSGGEKSLASLALLFAIQQYILILILIIECLTYIWTFLWMHITKLKSYLKKKTFNLFLFSVTRKYRFSLWTKVMQH